MFSGVDISLNATQVTTPTNTYPYPAMIETLLSYGADAKQSQLTSALFYADQPARMDAIDFAEANRNSGLYARSRFTAASRIVDMMGRTHADMFFQDRYLLNEVHVKIKLIRSRNSFCLITANEFKVKIDSAIMFLRKVKLSPFVFLAHAKALENSTDKYPIRRVMCKTITISNDFRDKSHEKLFAGQLLTRLVIALVSNDSFNGAFDRNPFNFEHFNLIDFRVLVRTAAVWYKTTDDQLCGWTLRASIQHAFSAEPATYKDPRVTIWTKAFFFERIHVVRFRSHTRSGGSRPL